MFYSGFFFSESTSTHNAASIVLPTQNGNALFNNNHLGPQSTPISFRGFGRGRGMGRNFGRVSGRGGTMVLNGGLLK